jgi:hypothetical protein
MQCRGITVADVKIMGNHSTMQQYFPLVDIDNFVAREGLTGRRLAMTEFGHFKYTIDIDGHANAWSFLEKLILGCCVLKVSSPYEQWLYERVRPWRHFVPVAADLSDLEEKIDWCSSNDAECQWIAQNGANFASSVTFNPSCIAAVRKS